MQPELKKFVKSSVLCALALSIVVTIAAPLTSNAVDVDVTTAKSNETSTNNVLGGEPTRITWEMLIDDGEEVAGVHLVLPEGSSFTDDSSVRMTVLDGIDRLDNDISATIDKDELAIDISCPEPLTGGLRLRAEIYDTALPNVDGEVHLGGTYTLTDGRTADLPESPGIEVAKASVTQRIVNWLDKQPWVQAWDSVTILNLFFQPQLIVSSLPNVFHGWLLSLMLVAIGFPLAIPLGLLFAFMKIFRNRILHAIAAVYTGVIRGTPLFLQIYIAFFGLPLMGVNLNEYLLAILVLAFNSGAYLTEIFRAGIQSIPQGQTEAARSLGMTSIQTMFRVIIPQMVRRVIPTCTSEFILLYKDTSLLAAVGVMELMLYAKSFVATTGNMTPYIVAACFYLVVTLPLIRVVTHFENSLARADGNAPPSNDSKRKKRREAKRALKDQQASTMTSVEAAGAAAGGGAHG
ncbi:MAG: amino acid ABC transporter permease [Coriobacteriaceae bacterium]|nr:amino acid ABC transporter permease [Coriobacteriaceae bacterium]